MEPASPAAVLSRVFRRRNLVNAPGLHDDAMISRRCLAQIRSQQLSRSTASAIATKIFRVPEYGARPWAVSMLSSSITSPA